MNTLKLFNFSFFSVCLLLGSISVNSHAFETVRVADGVYAFVGDLGQRSEINLGHNMTSGFIETDEAIVLIDSGGSIAGAKAIHKAIRKISPKPVKWIINTGGQDHRWIGNSYFYQSLTKQSLTIISSDVARRDMINRTAQQFNMAKKYIKNSFEDTSPVYPDKTFKERYILPVKGKTIELIYTGGGHTAGDIFVYLPDENIVFSGDIVFSQRLLGVQPGSAYRWIKSLEYLRDELKPKVIVPGHGEVTNLTTALNDSYAYLVMLRNKASQAFEAGAFDAVEASEGLDQSAFSYLENYSNLSFRSRNALRVAEEVSKKLESQ